MENSLTPTHPQLPMDLVSRIIMTARPRRPELTDLRDMIAGFAVANVALTPCVCLEVVKERRGLGHRRCCDCTQYSDCYLNPANYAPRINWTTEF